MKRFLVSLILISFLISSEVGRYQLTVSSLTSSKGKVYVVETVLDTKTGKIVGRNKILLSMYNRVDKK
jgi:hypothetical protein